MNKFFNVYREIKTWFLPNKGPKVICIGLHKTGTTSLAKALEILGYRVKDYPSVRTIGNTFLWLKGTQLDDYNAFTDSTIIPLYKRLDSKFEDIKFIMTDRELESWLKSCSKWSNFTRANVTGKRKIYRKKVLGAANYDESTFSNTYKSHKKSVLNYFSDRSNDLLILKIDEENKWEKLCEFLGHPIPDVPYPYSNKRQYSKK